MKSDLNIIESIQAQFDYYKQFIYDLKLKILKLEKREYNDIAIMTNEIEEFVPPNIITLHSIEIPPKIILKSDKNKHLILTDKNGNMAYCSTNDRFDFFTDIMIRHILDELCEKYIELRRKK